MYTPDSKLPSQMLVAAIEHISDNFPDARLAGSIGRAGVHHLLHGDSYREYRGRGQNPLRTFSGKPADLDLINFQGTPRSGLTFPVDQTTLGGRQVAIVQNANGDWILCSENRSFEAEIDRRTMDPVDTRTVFGAKCRTLPPQTQLALLGITGTIREKDALAIEELRAAINESDLPMLPDALFDPFYELFELNYKTMTQKVRRIYRKTVPVEVRRKLAPHMKVMRRRLNA